MAKNRNREAREPRRGALDERRRLIAAGSLSTAVVIVLVFGAVLRTDAPFADTTVPLSSRTTDAATTQAPIEAEPEEVRRPAPRTPPATASPPAQPAARRARPDGSLGERAAADRDRLIDTGRSYTLQLMVSCDLDNARRNLELIGDTSRLYVLPVELDGESCYRLCWGAYASREGAERASDLPAAFDSPRVQPVEELTR